MCVTNTSSAVDTSAESAPSRCSMGLSLGRLSRIETKARGEEGYVQGGCGSGSSKGMKWFIIVLPDGELNCGVC